MSDGESTSQGPTPPASTPPVSKPPPSTPPAGANGARKPEEMTVGELVFEVSDRASVLIREEIELAKTEVTEKVQRLLRGSIAGLVAAVFVLLALALAMHGFAWLLNDLVFDNFWAGFFVEAGLYLLIAAGAGFFAYRSIKNAAPPTPEMAIEEAKEIKLAFDGEEEVPE
jgi:uncharacterized membrane protein YqjE